MRDADGISKCYGHANSTKTQPSFLNAPNPNHQVYMQNNGVVGIPQQPQGQNFMPPFMQPQAMNAASPFVNAPNHNNNHFPLQNNHMNMAHMGQPHVGGLGPQNSANYNNPMFHVQGQVIQNAAQLNISQQILAQSIMSMLQQPNMNMGLSSGQFCGPYPMQNMNMNQQLPMQMPNPSQGVPYGMHPGSCPPMLGFPNHVPQGMVPQSSMFSANPQLGLAPGNQVGPQINPNEKNLAPPNVNTNAFPSQQLQGNTSGSFNPDLAHTSNPQPPAFMKSHLQENPSSNTKTNVPCSNWKGSPCKNFKHKPNRSGFQGGLQKSKFHDVNNGKRRFGKEHNGKGPNSGRAEQDGLRSKEHKQQLERSFSVTYTDQEIQQWREARKNNHPFSNDIQKKHSERPKDSKAINREVLQRELKEVLAKQAELGVEVAEIPSYYLKNSEYLGVQSEGRNKFNDKKKFQNKFNKRSDRKGRLGKKQKFADKDFLESPSLKKRKPTLLQKLLSADIKRDKSHLFQVFRFMAMNSFFKHCPDKPLRFPSVVVKENGSQVKGEEKYFHPGKDVLKRGNAETVQKMVNLNNDNGRGSDQDSEDDDNDPIVDNDPHKEPSLLVKKQCDSGEGIEKSDEEEGEIIE